MEEQNHGLYPTKQLLSQSIRMKPLHLQYWKIISCYNFESLWFPNTKGIKAVEGGRIRMTIKWMLTRQHHSRSVDKRTVFIPWFSNHAKKKMTHLNQERCWGFGDGFLGAWGANKGEKALLLPPGGATDDFITDCKICWLHDTLRCYCHLTLSG